MSAIAEVEGVAELVEQIREARAEGAACVAVGNNTRAAFGAPLAADTRRISTRALTGVTSFEADDLTCGVRVGTSWSELLACVEAEGLTIDAGPFARAAERSVGGVFAEAPPSSRGFDRASLRSHVLGMSAVDGHGRAFHSGGKVVKNVAGYDLCKLFVGGGGARFAVTELHLRLTPLPEAIALTRSEVMAPAEAAELWLRTRRAISDLRACDLVVTPGGAHVELLLAGNSALVRNLAARTDFETVLEGADAWHARAGDDTSEAPAYQARGRVAASRIRELLGALPRDAQLRVAHQGAAELGAARAPQAALPERCFLRCIRGAAGDYTTRAASAVEARLCAAFGATLAPERASFDTLQAPRAS